MDGEDFLLDILLNGGDGEVAGLEDLNVPITQDTQEVEVEEMQESRRSTNKGSRRAKNFHWKEDEVVYAGWLHVSKDPINGANQARSTFWGRVHAYFEEHMTTEAVRTESSIMQRWFTIQLQVYKFCSCYEAIKRRKQSGQTIHDMISKTSKLYMELDKDKKIHSYALLERTEGGRQVVELAEQEKEEASNKKKKFAKVSRPRDEEGTNNEKAITAAGEHTEARKRSDGINKVKENLRRGGGEACLEALDKIWAKKEALDNEKENAKQERFMASIEIDKETLELEKKRVTIDEKKAEAEQKKAEANLIKEEKEIMFMDMTSLNLQQRDWVESMRKEIVARCLAK